MYYFLKEDFDELNRQIEKITEKIREIGQDMGKSCEGGETYHDNFAFEDGERQQYMWSTRLRELIRVRNNARIAQPEKADTVSLGVAVTFEDTDINETSTIKIGSYMVFTEHSDQDVISYNAPLARILVGGHVGQTKEGVIASKKRRLKILKIEKVTCSTNGG